MAAIRLGHMEVADICPAAQLCQPTAIAKVPENERIDAKRMAQDIADEIRAEVGN